MRSALIILAVLISSFGASAAAAEPCEAVIGQWNWFIGGQVTLSEGGQARWQPGTVGVPPASGTWACDPGTGNTVVTWQNGFVDTLKLSPDGTKLSGKSSTGVAVNGWRSAPTHTGPGTAGTATVPAAPAATTAWPSTAPAKPPSTSGAIDHNPSVREILQDRPKPDPRGWKQDRSGGPQKGPKPFEGWE